MTWQALSLGQEELFGEVRLSFLHKYIPCILPTPIWFHAFNTAAMELFDIVENQ